MHAAKGYSMVRNACVIVLAGVRRDCSIAGQCCAKPLLQSKFPPSPSTESYCEQTSNLIPTSQSPQFSSPPIEYTAERSSGLFSAPRGAFRPSGHREIIWMYLLLFFCEIPSQALRSWHINIKAVAYSDSQGLGMSHQTNTASRCIGVVLTCVGNTVQLLQSEISFWARKTLAGLVGRHIFQTFFWTAILPKYHLLQIMWTNRSAWAAIHCLSTLCTLKLKPVILSSKYNKIGFWYFAPTNGIVTII